MHDRRMHVVCLSCFNTNDPAIQKVQQWLKAWEKSSNGHHTSKFVQVGSGQELLEELSNQNDVDVLILAAHGHEDGNFQMADKGALAASDVVEALKRGGLPGNAVLFLFACNGAKSDKLRSLFPANGRGPQLVLGATRLALSDPMRDAIKSVVTARERGPMTVTDAKTIVDEEEAGLVVSVSPLKVSPSKTRFLCVLWGPEPNNRYPPG